MAPPRLAEKEESQLADALGVPPGRALRLIAELREIAQGTLYRLPSQRPAAVVRELHAAVTQIHRGIPEPIQLSREAWVMIGRSPDAPEFAIEPDRQSVPELEQAIELAESFVQEADDRKGGRRADDRLISLVGHLARIYEQERRKRPTYTIDPQFGELAGPFGRFVVESFRLLAPRIGSAIWDRSGRLCVIA
jgi:hypothetical protein